MYLQVHFVAVSNKCVNNRKGQNFHGPEENETQDERPNPIESSPLSCRIISVTSGESPKKCIEEKIQNSPSGENIKKISASGTQQPDNNSHKNQPTGIRQLSFERNDDWVLKVRHHDTRISGDNHSDNFDSAAGLGVLRQSSQTSMPRSQQDRENVCP